MQQSTHGTIENPGRLEWMDSLRGLAIVLVLIWHAVSIPSLHGYPIPSWVEAANDFVLPFRMPTLMFLSGMLLHRSLQKPPRRYYLGKFRGLLWPYLIWGSIYIMQYPSEGDLMTPRAWIATGHLWFIFFITAYYFVAPLLKNLPVMVPPAACFIVSLALPEGVMQMFFYFAVFFFTGNAALRHGDKLEALLGSRPVVWVSIGIGVCLGLISATFGTEHNSWWIPANFAGILAAIAITRRGKKGLVQLVLRYLGRHSIYFYMSHFAVMTILLFFLESVGVTSPAVTFMCLVVGGASVGLVFSWFRHTPPFRWAFSPPNVSVKRSSGQR